MVGGFGTEDQPSPVGGPNTRSLQGKSAVLVTSLLHQKSLIPQSPGHIFHPQGKGGQTPKTDEDDDDECVCVDGWMGHGISPRCLAYR